MTDAHSAAAIVKTGAEGAAAWLPLLQTLAGGVLAGGVALYVNHRSHKNALEREEKSAAERLRNERQAAEEKFARERYFIGTELVFLLEQFGELCVPPATDYGDAEDESGYSISESRIPEISFAGIKGDWRYLPPLLMYRLRELEVMLAESHNIISVAFEHDDPPDFSEGFFRRQQQAVRLGIRAFILSAKLRNLCNMPDMKQSENTWSAPRLLWLQYREHKAICGAARRNGTTLGMEISRSAYYQRERAQ